MNAPTTAGTRTRPATATATATATVELRHDGRWTPVCSYGDLLPGRGVAVLAGTEQVAVFRDRAGTLYALQNHDPFSDAFVLSRGIMGSRGDVPVIASPMYKHVFDLRTGACLDEPAAEPLRVWPVRRTPSA